MLTVGVVLFMVLACLAINIKDAETSRLTETSFTSSYSSSDSGRFNIPAEGVYTQKDVEDVVMQAIGKLTGLASRVQGYKKKLANIGAYAEVQQSRVNIHCRNFLKQAQIDTCLDFVHDEYHAFRKHLTELSHMDRIRPDGPAPGVLADELAVEQN